MIEYMPQLKQGNLPGYTPGDIPQSSNLMSTEEGKCFFFSFSGTRELWKVNILPRKQHAECLQFPQTLLKYLKDKKQDSLQLVPKDAHMFFLGHYLFLETHSFPQALLSENCSHPGMFNIGRKISVDILACNGGYCSFIINVIVDFPNRR